MTTDRDESNVRLFFSPQRLPGLKPSGDIQIGFLPDSRCRTLELDRLYGFILGYSSTLDASPAACTCLRFRFVSTHRRRRSELTALRVYANSFRSIFCGFSNGSPSTLRRRESPRHHAHSKHTPRAHTPHPSSDRRMRRAVHHTHCRAHQRARRVTRRPANARSLHPIFNTYTARHYVAATTGCPGTTLKCRPPSEAC